MASEGSLTLTEMASEGGEATTSVVSTPLPQVFKRGKDRFILVAAGGWQVLARKI